LTYARGVQRPSAQSPTLGLILGLVITLAAVVAYSWYITRQIRGLRELQNNLADRNRKDSLQLLRIQDDLNSLGLAMRDMLDNDEPYPLTAWQAQFQRVRSDLDDAFRREEELAVERRTPEQREYLGKSLAQFWDAVGRTFALAQAGKQAEAREQIRVTLQARQAALSTAVARLLVENNEAEQQAAQRVGEIYDRVQRQVYIFLTAILIAILLTSLYVMRSNRRLFAHLATLSEQRSELAQKLITMQESTLREISRELHDEFGQILTAVGAMLERAKKHAPEDSPLRAELREVSEVAQTTLESVRSLSQALHPVMLDEAGLESTVEWYLRTVEKQTGVDISYEKSGTPFAVDGSAGVHVYRVLQEALNNVARHSGARQAWVRLRFEPEALQLEVEDHGKGLSSNGSRQGIGLVGMRERAELLHASLQFSQPLEGGTLLRLRVPRAKCESHA
ncbi:MAG TPA: histidine kinase, partial [Terriglobales bacterium]|nr:histidine kinase [Terriglobales bacterium]